MTEDEEWDREYNRCASVAKENNLVNSTWSVGPVDFEATAPSAGARVLRMTSHPFFGEPSGDFFEQILGSRWLDLWIAADKMLGRCGDKHHRFIEGFEQTGYIIELQLGS